MKLRKILQSGGVVRFHNHLGVDKQKNSEHQWGVALIVQHIYPDCSKNLLLAALTHDAAEYFTGDIPFPTKQASPELGAVLRRLEVQWEEEHGINFELTSGEEFILKMADTLEGMWYCVQQVRHGNINAKRPFRKWRNFLTEKLHNSGLVEGEVKARMLMSEMTKEMEEL